jgi:hypothetical protein
MLPSKLAVLSVTAALLVAPACATIVKKGKNWGQVQFRDTPELPGDQALALWVDGNPKPWKMEFSKVRGDTVISEPTIDLSTKGSHDVRVRLGGCEASFEIKPSVSGWWIVLDLTVGLGVGVLVDWATGSWADFGSAAAINTPGLMKSKGRPVDGMTPSIPCGG